MATRREMGICKVWEGERPKVSGHGNQTIRMDIVPRSLARRWRQLHEGSLLGNDQHP